MCFQHQVSQSSLDGTYINGQYIIDDRFVLNVQTEPFQNDIVLIQDFRADCETCFRSSKHGFVPVQNKVSRQLQMYGVGLLFQGILICSCRRSGISADLLSTNILICICIFCGLLSLLVLERQYFFQQRTVFDVRMSYLFLFDCCC